MDGIRTEQLCKQYQCTLEDTFVALDNINLTVYKGETLAIVGESGSGKSTLARMLAGIERPSSGRVLIDGEDSAKWSYSHWKKRRHKIQAVFQDASGTLNQMRSTYQNAQEGLVNLTSLTKKERESRIFALMDEMQLGRSLLHTPVRQLSGGEKRRISLLRALAVRPDYLILDEVTSGLDLLIANTVLDSLERFIKNKDCSCVFITHDRNAAFRIADRISVMNHGKIVRSGKKI